MIFGFDEGIYSTTDTGDVGSVYWIVRAVVFIVMYLGLLLLLRLYPPVRGSTISESSTGGTQTTLYRTLPPDWWQCCPEAHPRNVSVCRVLVVRRERLEHVLLGASLLQSPGARWMDLHIYHARRW
jgi:hypothetical protein